MFSFLMTDKSCEINFYENDLDIFDAEIWAREAILALQDNMVIGNLVHRDFSPLVAKFNDVVNVARPGTFEANRKGTLCENIVQQDASADSIQIPLNQFPYVSFKICDGEENRPMVDLIDTLMLPAVQALALQVDLIISGQYYNFMNNNGGHLGLMTSSNFVDYLLDTRETMNNNNVPEAGRNLILTTPAETMALKVDLFVSAERVGDGGRALREASLGRKHGFNIFRGSNQPYIRSGQATQANAVNNASGYAAGTTTLTIDGSGTLTAGMWVKIAGDETPHQVTAATGSPTTSITITPALKYGVVNDAVITSVSKGAVGTATYTSGYAGPTTNPSRPGYAKKILTDGWSGMAPQVGQIVSFGTATDTYTIIKVNTTDNDGVALGADEYALTLDRPLAVAIANNAAVNLGPAGHYNMAFTRNALSLVTRPLPKPRTGTLSSVISYNGLSIRVVISYDATKQAHIVTLDLLMGVGVFDSHLGAVMLG